jgi:hypothetical protein
VRNTMKGKTLLKGHALFNEGIRFGESKIGPANCECGAQSENLPNTSQRQNWHRAHKESIKKEATNG